MSETIDNDIDDLFFGNLYADEGLPDELYRLIHDGLVTQLETRLNEITNPKEYLHVLRWYGREQFSLLMAAAYYGHASIVELLLGFDCSDEHVELSGKFYIAEEQKRLDGATALYCACYRGHFHIAKILIDVGHADVTSSTVNHLHASLLTHASMHNRLDIVRFLIDNDYTDVNGDENKDSKGWTPLFHALHHNHTSIIEYLLEKDADVHYSCGTGSSRGITALSITISRNHFESFHLLCQKGAHLTLKNDQDKSFFKTAVKMKSYPMINFFLDEHLIDVDDVECVAGVTMSRSNDSTETQHIVELLRVSLQYRRHHGLSKNSFPSRSIFNYHRECETIEELDQLLNDRQRLLIEAILILERLFSSRKETSFHSLVETFGFQLIQQGEYEQCLDLWLHSTEFDQQHGGDYGMHLFVWYFCKLLTNGHRISTSRFLQAAYLIFKPETINYGEKDVNNALFLIVIAMKILQQTTISADERISIYQWIQQLCQLKSLVTEGRTLLHLCVDRRTQSNLTYHGSDTTPHISFPNAQATFVLLSYGRRWLDVNTMDRRRNTPLHIHCQSGPDAQIIRILLHFGAHLDCPNNDGKVPSDFLREKATILSLLEPKPMPSRLKCLCARVILQKNLSSSSSSLKEFLLLHGDLTK